MGSIFIPVCIVVLNINIENEINITDQKTMFIKIIMLPFVFCLLVLIASDLRVAEQFFDQELKKNLATHESLLNQSANHFLIS